MASPQNLIDQSILRRRDPNGDQWDSSGELLYYLQDAVNHLHNLLVANNSELAMTESTQVCVASTQEYALKSDFLAFSNEGVWITGSDSMTPATHAERVANGNTEGTPTKYYITASNMGFVPVPDATPTVNVRYFTTPSSLTLTGSMPYSDIFNSPIKRFMESMAFLRNENPTEGRLAQIYEALTQAAMLTIRLRMPDVQEGG